MNAVPAKLRDASAADFPAILALNAASVHFLSPLDAPRLRHLHAQAAYHRVIETPAGIAAFLLAFGSGAQYDSPNYRWFASRYAAFMYIDRIVVDAAARGSGLGVRLYDDLFAFTAQRAIVSVTCEFDLDPPNPRSAQFHARLGFREVGRQQVGAGKLVSLQLRELEV